MDKQLEKFKEQHRDDRLNRLAKIVAYTEIVSNILVGILLGALIVKVLTF